MSVEASATRAEKNRRRARKQVTALRGMPRTATRCVMTVPEG